MQADTDLYETAPGIFYTNRPVVRADRTTIALLTEAARRNPRGRARLCAHPDPRADQHDMLIVSLGGAYVRPHRHPDKSETMLVLSGDADAVLFDDAGVVTEVIEMGPVASGCTFFYRMPAGQFHGLVIRSEALVFAESTKGPFLPTSSEMPAWAPDDGPGVAGFCERVEQAIAEMRG